MDSIPITPSNVVETKSYSELAIERYLQISELRELTNLSNEEYTNVSVQCHLPKQLFNSIFCGHKATDLDSIASAIGAAELFHGVAARASEVNNETAHALKIWELDVPLPYVEACQQHPDKMTVIVDHNQKVQCPDHLNYDKLIGVIDHHAMQGGTVSTASPIYVNIHPWGSACTIIATMFFQARRSMSRQTAGILLSGILSDTLNLRSPTTTEYDCLAVSLLAKYAKVSDTNALARSLFKAKSMELLRCTPHQLVRGDLKTFECYCRNPENLSAAPQVVKMAFGVIETTEVSGLVALREKLAYELRALKAEEGKDLVFMALVDIVSLDTQLLLLSSREQDLATRVFGGPIDPTTGLMHLTNKVSRKKDFIPPLEKFLSQTGWAMPALNPSELHQQRTEHFGRVELECTEFGCQTVRAEAEYLIDEPSTPCSESETCSHKDDESKMQDSNDAHRSHRHHHHHHHHHHAPRGLTAADLTRRLLTSYKLKGPHIPTEAEVSEAIQFVLGGTTATITQTSTGDCIIGSPVKRSRVGLDEAQSQQQDDLVPLPGLDAVKRQRTSAMSPAAFMPKSPSFVASNMHIAADLNHHQAEELIEELLTFVGQESTLMHNMEEHLQLPSKQAFHDFIARTVDSSTPTDPSVKFLLVALAHALSDQDHFALPPSSSNNSSAQSNTATQ